MPAVSVLNPKTGAQAQEIVLPGNLQAFKDTPIYARTSGYLKRWYTDIGTRVKAGQLLAEIETPEIDDQLKQARADRATAEANYELSKVTATRWQELLKTDAVAKQATDQAVSDFHARDSMLQSARFNEARLEKLVAFEKVYAPFDGVITARNTDVGALINAGSTGGAVTELFHMADTQRLRVFVFVPQAYAQEAQAGRSGGAHSPRAPGKALHGSAGALDGIDRPDVSHAPGRGRRGQPHRGAASGRLCASPSELPRRAADFDRARSTRCCSVPRASR